jgi:hypothetical protein
VGNDRVDYRSKKLSGGSASQVSNLAYSESVIWTRECPSRQ